MPSVKAVTCGFFFIVFYTNLRICQVMWSSISKNDDKVRYVAAITCRWSQHSGTNIFKCSSDVGASSRVSEWQYGWLKWSDWRVDVQIDAGSNATRKRDKTHACVTAVNIQPWDPPWHTPFHQAKVVWTDTPGFIHHENDVIWTVHHHRFCSYNAVLCTR